MKRFIHAGLIIAVATISSACAPKSTEAPAAPDSKNVYFDSAKHTPRANEDYFELGRVAGLMERDDSLHVLVVGHTDSVGSSAANRKLAFKRASEIKQLLGDAVPAARARTKVAFHGEERPTESNRTKEGRARNRRVELYFYYLAEGEDEQAKLQSEFDGKLEFRAEASASLGG